MGSFYHTVQATISPFTTTTTNICIFILAVLATIIFFYRCMQLFSRYVFPRLHCFALRYFVFPLLLNSSRWIRATPFEMMLMLSYFILNVVPLCIGNENLHEKAAAMALVNLAPTFLGKHTNPVAAFLGITIPTHHLLHHLTGRMAILQASIHIFLMLKKWDSATGQMVSGYLVSFNLPSFRVEANLCTRPQHLCSRFYSPLLGFVKDISHGYFPSYTSSLALCVYVP